MIGKFSFWPEQASSVALGVDLLYIFIIVVTVAVTLAVYAAAAMFIVKYRRRSEDEIPSLDPNFRLGVDRIRSTLP